MKKIVFSFLVLAAAIFAGESVSAQNIGSLKEVVSPGFSFTMDLRPGYTDTQVRELQRVLNADADTVIALTGEGSKGKETTYYGELTKQAVIRFQEKYSDSILIPNGLYQGNGIVGKSTRTRLNLLIGVINTTDSVGTPQSSGVTTTTVMTTPTYSTQPVVTQTTSQSAICNLIQLLINIGAISQDKAGTALGMFGCVNSYSDPFGNDDYYDDEDEDEDEDIFVYCYSNLTMPKTNQSVNWTAVASGGDGDYDYSWSGTDDLSGNRYQISKMYTSIGTKSASVRVRSDGKSKTANCPVLTVLATTTQTVPVQSGEAFLLVNGQSQVTVNRSQSYILTYNTAGLSCIASTTPAVATSTATSSRWLGDILQKTGTMFLGGLSGPVVTADRVYIYGPNGNLIDSAPVKVDTGIHARFKKKGKEYPDGSYVSIKGQTKCLIKKTKDRVESCVPVVSAPPTIHEMKCNLPVATSSVSSFYTSYSVNPALASTTWPIVKTATVNYSSTTSQYPFRKFLWKPESESDSKLVIIWGSFPEGEEEEKPGTWTEFGGKIVGVGDCAPDDGNHYKDFQVEHQTNDTTVVIGWWPGQGVPEPKVGDQVLGGAWSKGKPKCTSWGGHYDPLDGTIDSNNYIGMAYEMETSSSGNTSTTTIKGHSGFFGND